MNTELIAGAAVSTPLNVDLTVDTSLLIEHLRDMKSSGINLFTLFGSTGEGASFSLPERNAVIEYCNAAGILPEELGSGIFALSSGEAGKAISDAFSFGCGHVLLAPPLFFKGVGDEGLYRWFSETLELAGPNIGPVILYHIPALTQLELSLELIERLSKAFPEIITGLKDSSGNWAYTENLLENKGRLKILIGHEGQLERGMRSGASGAIAGTANIIPDIIKTIVHDQGTQQNLPMLIDELIKYPIFPAVKAMIAHRKEVTSWLNVRPPLVGMITEESTVLCQRLDVLFPS